MLNIKTTSGVLTTNLNKKKKKFKLKH